MATVEERRDLRLHLIDLGFLRYHVTRDGGDGVYKEGFAKGANKVEITWGPKTDHVEFDGMAQTEPDRYVVQGPQGFTEKLGANEVTVLVSLGLIIHERSGYVMEDGRGNGVGALHHFYKEKS